VYAGGRFSTARPAGAAAGTHTVRRTNLLAYDIRTGALVSSFAPTLNGQVLGVAGSPDGKRVYVAGEFTTVNGAVRDRIAAFDTATGRLVSSFAPALDFRARALAVTATRVYVGGAFTTANGQPRARLAAFDARTGTLLGWRPAADAQVLSMVLAPGGRTVVVGGQFTTLAGVSSYGLGALDVSTGAAKPFQTGRIVRDAGANAGITSLVTDGRLVYGTGYVYGPGGNLEGSFAATPADGTLVWLEDCHGDTYSAFPAGGVLYTVSHAHFCGNIGGFPETTPRTFHRALAFGTAATGKVTTNTIPGYADFAGRPAPSLLTWFPDLTPGKATGQNQAAWSVTGNSSYVVLGGEFTSVNGRAQQGLVRFAVSSLAPNKQGPTATPSGLALKATVTGATSAQVTWRTTWDRDNIYLRYTLRRSDKATPVFSRGFVYPLWRVSRGLFNDSGLKPGSTYTYRLTVTDPFGNAAVSTPATVTIPR
jgi:hypothetical protein